MANIVGLGNTQDAINTTGQRRLRDSTKLADGLDVVRPTELRPVASPVETYAKPAQAPINHDLENLAAGLASLNPALQHFAKATTKDDKEIDKDALAAKYGRMSAADLTKVLQSGEDPELSNKYAAGFVGNIRASKQGDEDGAWWNNHYNTEFDKQNGDLSSQFDEFVAKRVTDVYGQNSAGANAYMERMAGVKRSLMERYLKDKEEQNTFERQQATQDGFATIARQAIDTGASPQKIMADTANFMQTNKAVMRLPYKEQQKYLLNAVDPLLNDMDASPEKRDQIYAAVNAIFTLPRKGEDGQERRLIDASDGLGQMAKEKLAQFDKKRNELNDKYLVNETARWKYNATAHPDQVDPKQLDAWDKANPGAFKTGEKEAILIAREKALDEADKKLAEQQAERDAQASKADVTAKDYQDFSNGDFFLPTDKDVPTKDYFLKGDQAATQKFTSDQRKQAVIDRFNEDLNFQKNQLVNSKKMTPEQAEEWSTGQQIAKYGQAGMVPSEWKQQMQAGANQLTYSSQTNSKEMPQGAIQAYQRYKLLATKAPNLLSQVADERTRAIFETAMQADGNETEQLRGALYYYGNHNEQTEKVAQKSVTEAVTKMNKENTGWGDWAKSWFGGETPENLGALNDDIQKRASYLVQAYHMPAEMALKKATQSLKDHYTLVNGWAVSTNDKRLPPNFKVASENYIRNVVTRLGQDEVGGPEKATTDQMREAGLKKLGIEDYRDLTLIGDRNGNFRLFDKRNGHPVLEPIPVDWKDGNRDGRFLTPDMIRDLSVFERNKEELRALSQGSDAQERNAIAARERAALKQGAHQLGLDQEASTRFIYNKNSVGRPAYKPPAPWLDLEAQTKNPFKDPFIYNNNSQGKPSPKPQTPIVDLEAQTKNPFGKPFIKNRNSR